MNMIFISLIAIEGSRITVQIYSYCQRQFNLLGHDDQRTQRVILTIKVMLDSIGAALWIVVASMMPLPAITLLIIALGYISSFYDNYKQANILLTVTPITS